MKQNIIEAKKLAKVYGKGDLEVKVLNDIDVEFEKGKITTILGPSGGGKTTMLNLLSGLDSPTSGQIIVDGQDIAKFSKNQLVDFRKDKIGFIFQQYNLVNELTVAENVELAASLSKNPYPIDELLKKVGLDGKQKAFPTQLSGGQQQRVAIARSIAKRPSILFCDEPTGALDENTGKEVLALIQQLNNEGTSIIIITHNPAIADISHRVIRVNSGNIVEVIEHESTKDAHDIK